MFYTNIRSPSNPSDFLGLEPLFPMGKSCGKT